MSDTGRRWDTDERRVGVADAAAFTAAIDEMAVLARRPGWVAEEPDVHLVPHLRAADVAGISVLDCRAGEDGVLEVRAERAGPGSHRDVRRRAWALIGAIAEPAACVRERQGEGALVFEIVTGVPEDCGPFATHGHTVRLTIGLPSGT